MTRRLRLLLICAVFAFACSKDKAPKKDRKHIEWDGTGQFRTEGKLEDDHRVGWWTSFFLGEKDSEILYDEDGRLVAKRSFNSGQSDSERPLPTTRSQPLWLLQGAMKEKTKKWKKEEGEASQAIVLWALGGIIGAILLGMGIRRIYAGEAGLARRRAIKQFGITTLMLILAGFSTVVMVRALYPYLGREPVSWTSWVAFIAFIVGVIMAWLPSRFVQGTGRLGSAIAAGAMLFCALLFVLMDA